MKRYDLTKVQDRRQLVGLAFAYPAGPLRRKHGPSGYVEYESYRHWLRDEFQYRCVFSLTRETWPNTQFDIDHLVPRVKRPKWTCQYGNLLYLTHQLNLIKGDHRILNPCRRDLNECLRIHLHGKKSGQIEALNDIGETWVEILDLNSEDAVEMRKKWIGILYSVAQTDEMLFRQLIGYPPKLPDLATKKPPNGNSRIEGIATSAASLRVSHCLPDYY